MVVDFRDGHPAALTAEAHKRAVAVDGVIVARNRGVQIVAPFGAFEFFEFGQVLDAVAVGVVHFEVDHIVFPEFVRVFVLGGGFAAALAVGGRLGLGTRFGLFGGALFLGLCLSPDGFFARRDGHVAANLHGLGGGHPLHGLKIGKDHVIDNFFEFFRHHSV